MREKTINTPVSRQSEECSLKNLLGVFNAFPSLFSDDAPDAKTLRDLLKVAVDVELKEVQHYEDLRALLTWKLIVGCPELLDIKAKAGFEWLADDFRNMLDKQAIAHNYGLLESTLYSSSLQKTERQREKRGDVSFDGLLRLVKTKVGRPAELKRDIDRAIRVRFWQRTLGLNKTHALRYVAGMETASNFPVRAAGKRIEINVGTQNNPKYVCFPFYEKGLVKDESGEPSKNPPQIFRVEPDDSVERRIQGSIKNVKDSGLELLEIPYKNQDEAAEWQGAIIPMPRSYITIIEGRGLLDKLTAEIQERMTDHLKT